MGCFKICISVFVLILLSAARGKEDQNKDRFLISTAPPATGKPDSASDKNESSEERLKEKRPRLANILFSTLPPTSPPPWYQASTSYPYWRTTAPFWYHPSTTRDWYHTTHRWHPSTSKYRYTTSWYPHFASTYPYYHWTTRRYPHVSTSPQYYFTTRWHPYLSTKSYYPYTTRWHNYYQSTYPVSTKPWYYHSTAGWQYPTTARWHKSTYPVATKPWYYHTTAGWKYPTTARWHKSTYPVATKPWYYHTTKGWQYPTTARWHKSTYPVATKPWYYHTTKGWQYPTTAKWTAYTTPWYHRRTTYPYYHHTTRRHYATTPYYTRKSTPWWFNFSTTKKATPWWTPTWYHQMTTPATPTGTGKPTDQLLMKSVISQCSSSGWNVIVNMLALQQAYPSIKGSDLYLGENSCVGREIGYNIIFSQSLQGCRTAETVTSKNVIYRNEVVYAPRDSSQPFSNRRRVQWTVDVECDVARNGSATAHIHHERNETHPHVTGVGSYDVRMAFYSDSNFVHPIAGNPLHVPVGTQVYTKVYTTALDWNIKMKVDTCYTLVNIGDPYPVKSDLIYNGCETDPNTHFITQSTHETRFVFQDFQYRPGQEGFDIKCDVTFCAASDVTDKCNQACHI